MRILFGFLMVAAFLAGEAQASSFVMPEPLEAKLGPSMILLGDPSPSVIYISAPGPEPVATAALSYPYPGEKVTQPAARPPVDRPSSFVTISRSMIALGEPPIAYEKVAAIAPAKETSRPRSNPMVIRGGVLGDAFTRSAPASVPVAAPEPTQEASSAPAGGPSRAPARREEPREPIAPAPAPVAPSPPTRSPE